jgi:predicted ATPase/DNA-binding CsgD family transcriptional regulator
VAQAAVSFGPSGLHGFTPILTSFVGRSAEVAEIAELLGECRLVTLLGPGGVGKTRLAVEVASQIAHEFDDGAWLVDLVPVRESALVAAAAAAALGVLEVRRVAIAESLAAMLARRQALLVLDNCEHVVEGVAALCGMVLSAADEVRILATSREPVGVAGEARYRVPPLTLPRLDAPADLADSEAVTLFTERARRAYPHFSLRETGTAVAELVTRLDGIPLAIELASARVETLGVGQLLERLDDRFRLLVGPDRLAAPRHRSLEAMVDWSYDLLSEQERRVFRRLSVFPGPFTLEAAEAVAGPGADEVVLRLVDHSLLVPPRTGSDGRVRYPMLETLRAYGAARLADGAEQRQAAAALAEYALGVAEQAAAGLQTAAGELAAAQWLDAEEATTHQALSWALDNDPPTAVRLAIALASWWRLRGRGVAGYALLGAAAEHTATGDDTWCAAQLWLGQLTLRTWDLAAALGHFTAVCEVVSRRPPSTALVDALTGKSAALRNLNQISEARENAQHALAAARDIGYPAGETLALLELGAAAYYVGDHPTALTWARQAQAIDQSQLSGWVSRRCVDLLTNVLAHADDPAAGQSCADLLARARGAGDLHALAAALQVKSDLDPRTGQIASARTHLQQAIELTERIGDQLRLILCLENCGFLCAATGRWADAITMFSAYTACRKELGTLDLPQDARRRQETLQTARQILSPGQVRAAEERGAAMRLRTAIEVAALLAADDPHTSAPATGSPNLTPRERQLIILVAQGHTDAQIAQQLSISLRTTRSHLDRIRDKTNCRRRADLTRLALRAGLL